MKRLHLLLLPTVVFALSFGLAACGGGDGSEGDEDSVVETIETAVFSTDPADCKRLATQTFIEQSQFEEGEAAVKGCEEDAAETEDDPDSVEVTDVKIEGDRATAKMSIKGGNFDRQTIALDLVEEDGTWKLNEITEFVKLDQGRFIEVFEEEATRGDDALPRPTVACIGEDFGELSPAKFEQLIIGGEQQPLLEIIEGCLEDTGSAEL